MIASMEAIPKRPPESSSISSSIPHLPLSIACYTVYSSIPTMSNLFFQEAKEFEMLLDNTANIVHKLKEASMEFGSVTTESSAMKEIKGYMEKDMDEVGKMAQIMKEKLCKMIGNVLI
nr:uncharacterized protein LOC127333182 [Lolium perenne]